MNDFETPVAFHFLVSFSGDGPPIQDAKFQEVSGLETHRDQEAIIEGGENRFVHQLPKPAKQLNIVLKRGVLPKSSDLVKWCTSSIEGGLTQPITPKDLLVSLLDDNDDAVASWSITNAYPIQWTAGEFDAIKNNLAIKTIELAFNTVKRKL